MSYILFWVLFLVAYLRYRNLRSAFLEHHANVKLCWVSLTRSCSSASHIFSLDIAHLVQLLHSHSLPLACRIRLFNDLAILSLFLGLYALVLGFNSVLGCRNVLDTLCLALIAFLVGIMILTWASCLSSFLFLEHT